MDADIFSVAKHVRAAQSLSRLANLGPNLAPPVVAVAFADFQQLHRAGGDHASESKIKIAARVLISSDEHHIFEGQLAAEGLGDLFNVLSLG